MDLGIALLRILIGALFIGHGTQKLFGWFGGKGLAGTGGYMESLGYRPGRPPPLVAGTVEAVAGLLLVLGLFIPLAAAGVIAVMVNAIGAVTAERGLWITEGGYEYNLVLIAVAVALAFSYGGGEWGAMATAAGIAGGVGGLLLRKRDDAEAAVDDEDDVLSERPAA